MASPSDATGRITPYQTASEARTTSTGAAWTLERWSFAGQAAIACVPAQVKDRTDITLVQHSHGYVDDQDHPLSARMQGTLDGILDRGWVLVSHFMHGNNWGSKVAMNDLKDAYHWAASRWHVKRVILHGFSMGGMATYNALGQDVVPDIVAGITVNGVVDILGQADWQASARAMYGGMNQAEMLSYMAEPPGYDPLRDDPAKWANKPIYMIGGSNDPVVPPPPHMEKFLARAATPELIHYEVGTHGHLAGFMPEKCLPWADTHAPTYQAQEPHGWPEPNWPTDPELEQPDPGPVTPTGSGVYWADGREASLYRPDGTLVRFSRT